MKNILVLGGYGNFGKRIVEDLSDLEGITVFIAGRNIEKAKTLKNNLESKALANLKPITLDINAENFTQQLKSLSPDVVIHTGGPFQKQSLRVPKACLDAGSHYIDLADDRQFVCNIKQLDQGAKNKKLLMVSGASSVPGLSSAVIEHYREYFAEINSLDIAIAPGNKAERGEATIRGILSYIGKPFTVFSDGFWNNAYGWMEPRKIDFGGIVGKRWLANVDVPDLELFPKHYSITKTVRFQAGLELPFLHWVMVGMAYLSKIGLVKNWTPLTKPIIKISNVFKALGTDIGGMKVEISGETKDKAARTVNWTLYADKGIGPYIPTISAIILAKKLISQGSFDSGAKPCVGSFDLKDFMPYIQKFDLDYREQIDG